MKLLFMVKTIVCSNAKSQVEGQISTAGILRGLEAGSHGSLSSLSQGSSAHCPEYQQAMLCS